MSYKHGLPTKLQSQVDLSIYCPNIFASSQKEQYLSNLPKHLLNTIAVKYRNGVEHHFTQVKPLLFKAIKEFL